MEPSRLSDDAGQIAASYSGMADRLADRCFRPSGRHELVPLDRLSESEQRSLARLQADPGIYGILRPRLPGESIRAISHDAALLLSALASQPGSLPAYVARDGPEALLH